MFNRVALLVLSLACGSCATERSVQQAANGIAATSAIVTAAVSQIVPTPTPIDKLPSTQQLVVKYAPVILLNAFAIWHAIDEIWTATHTADAGVPVDAGVP